MARALRAAGWPAGPVADGPGTIRVRPGAPDLAAALRGAGRDIPSALEAAIFGPGGFGYGDGAPCGCSRPSGIARRPDALAELLEDAFVHAWTVRVALRGRRKGEGRSFCAEVEDVGDGAVSLWCHDDDRPLETSLSSLEWARVLTEAEEEALFDGTAVR